MFKGEIHSRACAKAMPLLLGIVMLVAPISASFTQDPGNPKVEGIGVNDDGDNDFRKRQLVAAAEFFHRKALYRAAENEYVEALEALEMSIKAHPTVKAHRARAAIYMGLNENDKAMVDFEASIELEPYNVSSYRARAIALQLLGQNESAIDDYSKIIKLRKYSFRAWGNRGLARLSIGDVDGALSDLNEALRLNSNYDIGWYNRGLAWYKKGEFEKAIEDYDKALDLRENWEDAIVNRRIAVKRLAKLQG